MEVGNGSEFFLLFFFQGGFLVFLTQVVLWRIGKERRELEGMEMNREVEKGRMRRRR